MYKENRKPKAHVKSGPFFHIRGIKKPIGINITMFPIKRIAKLIKLSLNRDDIVLNGVRVTLPGPSTRRIPPFNITFGKAVIDNSPITYPMNKVMKISFFILKLFFPRFKITTLIGI